jgi:SAM-dependent methyltransferase
MSSEMPEDLYANWARIYDLYYPDRTDEVEFWADFAVPYGSKGLDAMCGTAEVSLGLARKGFRVIGVDLSPAMLHIARARLAAAADYPAQALSLVHADICSLPFPLSQFDWAIVGGNGSFNHLDASAARVALENLNCILRPGGGLALELINPHLLKEIYPERSIGPFRPTPPGVWVEKTVANRWDGERGLFHISQTTRCRIEGDSYQFSESFALHVWNPEAVSDMLARADFANVRFVGGYGYEPFDRWSSDLLVLADCSSRQ